MHHYAVIYKLNGGFHVYKDGAEFENCRVVADQWDGRFPLMSRPNAFTGKSNWRGDHLFEGIIEDMRIYRHEMSAEEVQNHYNSKRTRMLAHADSVKGVVYKSFRSLELAPGGPPTKQYDRET